MWACLIGSLIAGLAAWAVGETPIVRVEPKESKLVVMGQVTETVASTPEAIREAELQSAVRGLGIAGALLGLGLGLASGITSRRRGAALSAGAVGMVVGGILGAVAPLGAGPLYEAIRTPGKQELMPVILMHVAVWGPIGLAAGLAFGLGRWRKPGPILTSAIAGAIGGAIGAVVAQVIGSIAFPMAGVEKLVSETPVSRLLGLLVAALAIGLLVATIGEPGGGRKGRRVAAA